MRGAFRIRTLHITIYSRKKKSRKMSENRDEDDEEFSFFPPLPPAPPAGTSMGTATEGWKRINEKSKQVSKQVSASFLNPTETATETEGSGKKKTVKPSREGNADLLPFTTLTVRDDDHVISKSKPGRGSCSFKRVIQGLQDRASINIKEAYPLPEIPRVGEYQRSVHYLFRMELNWSDVVSGRLSIPFQTAEFHFPPTNCVSNYEHQIVITDAHNDVWYMTLAYNALQISEFKFTITNGWQGFVDWHGLKAMDLIRFYKPFPRLHTKHYLIDYVKAEENVISESKSGDRRVFLFEVQLTLSDVQQGRLIIPEQRAANHFPPIQTHLPDYNYEYPIEIFETSSNNCYYMTLLYNSFHSAFIITRGWHCFVVSHSLEAMDVIWFYKCFSQFYNKHFLVQVVKGGEEPGTDNDPPEFKPENFLFQLELTIFPDSSYNSFEWLVLPKEEVRNHFPAIEIPHGRRLKLTDTRNKDWSMSIFFAEDLDAYIIAGEWEGFANKHRLETMDEIRFYKPVLPLHEGHFLIECVKGEEAGGGTSSKNDQLGGAKKDGNRGDRANRGGRNHGGGRGGASRSGSSPGKGKTIFCWTWKNQRGGQERVVMAVEEFLQLIDNAWEEIGT
ncbi:unnamed protein product [Camellia sinensis]